MERESPLIYDLSQMVVVNYASPLFAPGEYSAAFSNFPGAHAYAPYTLHGHFFFSFEIWQRGKLFGTVHTKGCDESGFIHFDFDQVKSALLPDEGGILRTSLHCTKGLPIEMYMSHFHRSSGVYFSYPMLSFTGDRHYYHLEQMENTLFWPGITNNKHTQFGVCILNPYSVPISLQMHLYLKGARKVKSEITKVSSMRSEIKWLEDIFPDCLEQVEQDQGQCALCISAQYKVVSYVIFRDRESSAIHSVDHLHPYCLI